MSSDYNGELILFYLDEDIIVDLDIYIRIIQ